MIWLIEAKPMQYAQNWAAWTAQYGTFQKCLKIVTLYISFANFDGNRNLY